MRILLAGTIVLLSGCIGYGDCGFEPIGASIRAPMWPPVQAPAVGACGRWVDIDGYFWTQSNFTFELSAADLEPIGQADRTSDYVAPLADATTYEIAGVDPDHAIAMEAADGTFLVFTKNTSGPFPVELCPKLASDGNAGTGGCPTPP